jgi:hypothetical protein
MFASAVVVGLIGALATPLVAYAGYACAPTTTLSGASSRSVDVLQYGVELGKVDFEPGVANNGGLHTRVMWAKGALAKVDWVAPSNRAGETSSQYKLASDNSAIAFINTDYYNEGTRFPFNAMLRNGELTYAPARSTNVVASAFMPYTLSAGYPGSSNLKVGTVSVPVSGVNTGALPGSSSATVITYDAKLRTLPVHQAAVWIVNNKVSKIYSKGATKKLSGGFLILAKGSYASKIRLLKVGAKATYKLPTMPSGRNVMVSDRVWAYGLVSIGADAVRIRSVNSDSLDGKAANLYDSNYTTSRQTLQGKYTLVLDGDSNLTAKFWGGSPEMVPAGGKVIQLGDDGLDVYKAANIGEHVTVRNDYKNRSGLRLLHASGRGGDLLKSGSTVQVCFPNLEVVRPRTAIGWNNSTGQVWLITSSSGLNLNDFFFRQGGSTVHQITTWLRELGASDAVTVDGGGSTTFIAKVNGEYHRQDIPDEAWIREIPIGAAFVPKN